MKYLICGNNFSVKITERPQDITVSLIVETTTEQQCLKTYSYVNIDDAENAFNVMSSTLHIISSLE